MGARGDQYDHVLQADGPLELVEYGRDNGTPGLGPRPVADSDGHRLPGPDELTQRRTANWLAQRGHDRGPAVGYGRRVGRDDDIGAVLRQLDAEPGRAVGKLDFHAR
jgi:hypothetical protein